LRSRLAVFQTIVPFPAWKVPDIHKVRIGHEESNSMEKDEGYREREREEA
jgi:hypothetical protein